MKAKKHVNKTIIFSLILFFIISILSVYSSLDFLAFNQNIFVKQIIFYIVGFFIVFVIVKCDISKILKYSLYIYILNVLLLIYVLLFGDVINGSRAWIKLPFFGSFQPSEFMKIGLILYLAWVICKNVNEGKKDIIIILKSVLIFLIPTIFTFLEPDTGAVLIYFIITLSMLFVSGINKRWFLLLFALVILIFSGVTFLFLREKELFIEIFGSNFFYRFDRIFDWSTSSGMQLENSVISIASAGIFGHGFNNIPLYFPELQTDFIFASFVSCYGIIGATILFVIFIIFDNEILKIGYEKKLEIKLIATGIFAVLIYQQIQNTAMTIGVLPIIGITLPFISYGGSSLISFMILIGIILNADINMD